MELRQLSTFIQVAQLKSFSRAAESLGYSQSAVTVQIRQLEDELEAKMEQWILLNEKKEKIDEMIKK